MNKIGWFFTGFELCGIIIAIMTSFMGVGNIDTRIFLFVWGLLGIGYNIVFLNEKELKQGDKK